MIIAFTLTMPGAASWNGKWSGDGKLFVITRTLKKPVAEKVLEQSSYHYRWDDGWMAMVRVKHVDAKEAAKLRKKSNGFCGYDWMVGSILTKGKIEA